MHWYNRFECATFRKVAEHYGAFSNMAGGYPLIVNGLTIRTSEALYQACRFPRQVHVQQLILDQKSPMAAKMVTKPHRHQTREDWDAVRVDIMRWCLQVKLAWHWNTFGQLLRDSRDLPIVEDSSKDDFWGAKPQGVDSERLFGQNILGHLLMEIRTLAKGERISHVAPIMIPDFELLGSPIRTVTVG